MTTLVERLREAWKDANENSLLISEAANLIEEQQKRIKVLREALKRIPEVEWWEDARNIVAEALAQTEGGADVTQN